jgi:DnaJ-class molecular chaperone
MRTPCPTCHGHGYFEESIDCGRTAAYCCGGCSREIRCEECHGEGSVELSYEIISDAYYENESEGLFENDSEHIVEWSEGQGRGLTNYDIYKSGNKYILRISDYGFDEYHNRYYLINYSD